MPLADFTITVEFDQPRAVRVIVYDSIKALRGAATRYDNDKARRSRRRRGRHADTLGVCHRFEERIIDGDQDESQALCAIVRLAEPNLGVGLISHEMAHAAVWMRELSEGKKPLTCANDETFCWTLGELVRQTINTMTERGVYEDEDGQV